LLTGLIIVVHLKKGCRLSGFQVKVLYYIAGGFLLMPTSQSTRELISKHKVLTGFSRFMYFALVAIAINIGDSLYGSYKDYKAVYILSAAIPFVFLSLVLYKKSFVLAAIIISAVTFNCVFFLISLNIGLRGGTYLYYFPFILAYLYLFRTEGYDKYVVAFSVVSLLCLILSLIEAPINPVDFNIPDSKMRRILLLTLIVSFSLTIYFFVLIYQYQEKLYQRILDLEKSNKIQQLRSIIEDRETGIQNIVYELRNNVNQILAASKIFQQEYVEGSGDRNLIVKSYTLTNEAINTLSGLCNSLHPAIITDVGFIDGIRGYIDELKKTSAAQIQLEYHGTGIEEIDNMDKISIFRIIQDYLILVLNNPATSRVTIHVNYVPGLLTIALRQNDPHFNFMKTGAAPNLNDLQHRITYLKGTISQQQDEQVDSTVLRFPIG
jgi:signal transduction histidine kinase